MKKLLSFFLSLLIMMGTIANTSVTVYADYATDLSTHKKIDTILQNYVSADYHLNDYDYGLNETKKNELISVAKSAAKGCTTDYKKIAAITKFVASNIYYDTDYFEGRKNETYSNPYDVWKNKLTVCDGYARLTKTLLNFINIPCMTIVGFNHLYNAAYDSENDKWIYLDATWCSGNRYSYGKYISDSYVDTYFDMTLQELSSISNHEFFELFGIVIDNLEYSLETPWYDGDWTESDDWAICAHGYADINDITSSNITFENDMGYPVTHIFEDAFLDCTNIVSVTIPDSVVSIGSNAFENCTNLTSIYIPSSVLTIDGYAFKNCTSLESITIENNVEKIGEDAFWGTAFYNDDSNRKDGVLYIDNYLIDAYIPSLEEGTTEKFEYIVKKGTRYISPNAFEYCNSLTSIIIPDSVVGIGSQAFHSCSNITTVTMGKGVSAIEYGAFDGCDKLTDIYYAGSATQWSKMYIDEYNECVTGANIHFGIVEKPTIPKLTSVSRTASGVKLSWGAVEGADEYIVYRKTAKSGWTRLGTTTENTFTDTKAKTGTTYYYTVKAQNEAGASGYNKTGLKIKYVAAPKLTKIANEASGVRVYWSKVAGADGYYLYRRVAGTKSWTKIATIKKGTTTSYKDTKASAGKTYEYIIKCYDGSTPSAAAAKVIKIKRLTVPKLVSTSSSKTGITVKWGKVAGAEGYYVYRKTGSGSWVKIATVKGNTKVSFVDKTAKKGTTYTYTVKAYSGSYTSSYNTKGLKIKDKY